MHMSEYLPPLLRSTSWTVFLTAVIVLALDRLTIEGIPQVTTVAQIAFRSSSIAHQVPARADAGIHADNPANRPASNDNARPARGIVPSRCTAFFTLFTLGSLCSNCVGALFVLPGLQVHLQVLLSAEAELAGVAGKRPLLLVDERLVPLEVLTLVEDAPAVAPVSLRRPRLLRCDRGRRAVGREEVLDTHA